MSSYFKTEMSKAELLDCIDDGEIRIMAGGDTIVIDVVKENESNEFEDEVVEISDEFIEKVKKFLKSDEEYEYSP